MHVHTVDVGIACTQQQYHTWWGSLLPTLIAWDRQDNITIRSLITVGSALPDGAKSEMVEAHLGKNASLTSYNRNALVDGFERGEAEWLLQIDDDTLPPKTALPVLLDHQRPFVAGVYYHGAPPFRPIAYMRVDHGLYRALTDFERGALIEVDAVGMGCTLIHSSVFQAIRQGYRRFMRPCGSELLIHKDDIHERSLPRGFRGHTAIYGDTLVMPVEPWSPDRRRKFPFYQMEHGRTEDFNFCEKAERVGFKPWLDTSVECKHIKPKEVVGENWRECQNEALIRGEDVLEMWEEEAHAGA